MAKRKTQTEAVLSHLKKRGYITPAIAVNTYSIWRLAAVIEKLRKAGHDITTLMREDAEGHKYAHYKLA